VSFLVRNSGIVRSPAMMMTMMMPTTTTTTTTATATAMMGRAPSSSSLWSSWSTRQSPVFAASAMATVEFECDQLSKKKKLVRKKHAKRRDKKQISLRYRG